MSWSKSFRPPEDPEARVIRIVTETLIVHRASRKERGEQSPLSEQDLARIRLLAEFRRGPYKDTVDYLITEAFSDPDGTAKDGTPKPTEDLPEPEGTA